MADAARPRILAILGPTNTGKTHLAMERLLAHESGMIGFPLRLLARENYDRAVRAKGVRQVALITGEEKIVPPAARYWICTVESLPVERRAAFVAIDEIQMCADRERGHVFTDRLLRLRGDAETMFLGAESIAPLLARLVPEAEFVRRPRFSTLHYAGDRPLARLPARSAVVAFSASDVYALAEAVRGARGGTAVVLGALSPRTRNAQVAMFQAGEVDYLVATDAIGMGLNMDVDHVAFAGRVKFDGRAPRELGPAELAQIAGRAGRHMNDGTFGTTAGCEPFEPDVVERIETHRFDAIKALYWRSPRLDFASLAALRRSLEAKPEVPGLVRAREAADERALSALAQNAQVAARATNPEALRRLWDVCRIPDFRKVISGGHVRLLAAIYVALQDGGRLPAAWVGEQLARLDRTEGDIEALVQRIAHVRTWTYVSFHGEWLDDAPGWQAASRAIEDRLSDALHERLTQRFVDRKAAAIVSGARRVAALDATVDAEGTVTVEGHPVGRLAGVRFDADPLSRDRTARRAVANAIRRAIRPHVAARVRALEAAPDDAFALDADGGLTWQGTPVGRLARGAQAIRPVAVPAVGDAIEADERDAIGRRLARWLEAHLAQRLAPLRAGDDADLAAPARAVAYQVGQAMGTLPRRAVADHLRALNREDRRALAARGIRIGRASVFAPSLLRPEALALRALLWRLHTRAEAPLPPPGRVAQALEPGVSEAAYGAVGYVRFRTLALRADMLERLAAAAWSRAAAGPFGPDPALLSLGGLSRDGLDDVLRGLGFRAEGEGAARRYRALSAAERRRARPPKRPGRAGAGFATLGDAAIIP